MAALATALRLRPLARPAGALAARALATAAPAAPTPELAAIMARDDGRIVKTYARQKVSRVRRRCCRCSYDPG